MSARVTVTIPVRNGEAFLRETLDSLTQQTRPPDRVVVVDNCSTDGTEAMVRGFKGLPLEFIRNPRDLGLFGNLNRCLGFAGETDYLQILHADDVVRPRFYEVMTQALADCPGRGLAWCLDERIDEEGRPLSVSGKADARVVRFSRDTFLQLKAEIRNQAFCATLLKTHRQPFPAAFPEDMPIIGDMVGWAELGSHCDGLVHVREALAGYRWHGGNQTVLEGPSLQALVIDEWRAMERIEALRERRAGLIRRSKLKGMFAVRSGIKARRFREQGNPDYARRIVQVARPVAGVPLWCAGWLVVELREWIVFKIGGRRKHPGNVYG